MSLETDFEKFNSVFPEFKNSIFNFSCAWWGQVTYCKFPELLFTSVMLCWGVNHRWEGVFESCELKLDIEFLNLRNEESWILKLNCNVKANKKFSICTSFFPCDPLMRMISLTSGVNIKVSDTRYPPLGICIWMVWIKNAVFWYFDSSTEHLERTKGVW